MNLNKRIVYWLSMRNDEEEKRQQCFTDHSSYVKAEFYKFAVNYDQLNGKEATNVESLFKYLSGLDIKRIYVNMPMFLTYINSFLIPREAIRIIKLVYIPQT